MALTIIKPRLAAFEVRWVGVEPTRLAAHGPQPCLSANSSTSAILGYYNRQFCDVKRIIQLTKRNGVQAYVNRS